MSKVNEKELERLLATYECLLVSSIPPEAIEHQISLLSILQDEEIIADWKVCESDNEGDFDVVVFGWGEPRIGEDEDE
jgi:hypothetical protein